MGFLSSRIETLHFDHAIRAFEGRVHVASGHGEEVFTARAYLPPETTIEAVKDALSEVARRRFEALGSAGQRN